MNDEQHTQELIIRNEFLEKQISELLNKKRIYETEKNKNNEKLRKICNHNWVRQTSYEFHNDKIYQCSKCKIIY